MAGLGMLLMIAGVVTSWAGWTGRNIGQVIGATFSGGQMPQPGNNPFSDIVGGLPGLFAGAVTGGAGSIPGITGGEIGPVIHTLGQTTPTASASGVVA